MPKFLTQVQAPAGDEAGELVTLSQVQGLLTRQLTNTVNSTAYTLVAADAGKMVCMTHGSATVVTIPTNAQVAFPIDTRIDIVWEGAGQVTIAGFDGTVIINSELSNKKIGARYAAVSLVKRGTNTWLLVGRLTA